jgi:phosphocarrier protein
MIYEQVSITNKIGIHARPAGLIAKECSKFQATMVMKKNDARANMKSIFSLMKLQIKQGDTVIIEADGYDENEALKDILALIRSDFKGYPG